MYALVPEISTTEHRLLRYVWFQHPLCALRADVHRPIHTVSLARRQLRQNSLGILYGVRLNHLQQFGVEVLGRRCHCFPDLAAWLAAEAYMNREFQHDGRVGCPVCYNVLNRLAVWNQHVLIRESAAICEERCDGFDGEAQITNSDVVTDAERPEQHQQQPCGEVGQRVLDADPQRDRGSKHHTLVVPNVPILEKTPTQPNAVCDGCDGAPHEHRGKISGHTCVHAMLRQGGCWSLEHPEGRRCETHCSSTYADQVPLLLTRGSSHGHSTQVQMHVVANQSDHHSVGGWGLRSK
mmetsp:Transcript_99959/g.260605  ORF Transcript_99959/g.260605 Transcript_99959/m.260605 type:complete len:294 (-) Transcript_99959:136-1017(-)